MSQQTANNEAENQSSCSAVSGNVVTQITPIQTDDWTNRTYKGKPERQWEWWMFIDTERGRDQGEIRKLA